ncbi:MAG TPA: LemA family protein [Verrucomicrobiae bacterium]|nr:LemA family protein [Verrucomicrobiae bacterium]
MKMMGCVGIGILVLMGIAALLALVVGGQYNNLVGLSQGVDKQWAQVQNVYQRRADLIPNLVQTVSGAAHFEKSTLAEVVEARAKVGQVRLGGEGAPADAAKLAEFQRAQDGLSSALSRLLVVVERYPDLKANANFRDLQVQLEGTENRISVERGRFNEVVQGYNTAVKRFPAVFVAGMLGFHPRAYFEAKAGAEEAPKVKFDFGGQGAAPAPARP